MQRRQLITLLGCTAALGITGLPALEYEPPRWVVERMPLFVGLGNAGVNFVRAVAAATPRDFPVWPHIAAAINRSDGKSAMPLEAADRTRLISEAMFPHHRQEVTRVILMTGLSRSTGGELVSEVAERYLAEGASVSIVATLPFRFEGRHWRTEAERQLAGIETCGARVVVVDNAAVIADLPEGTTLLQAFRLANQHVVQAAEREVWSTLIDVIESGKAPS